MKAAWYEQFGAPDDVLTVGELEDPKPGPGEVLVRLKASSVNPSDVKKRAGSFPNLLDDGYVIPHSDGAGVIESVARASPVTASAMRSGSIRRSTVGASGRPPSWSR